MLDGNMLHDNMLDGLAILNMNFEATTFGQAVENCHYFIRSEKVIDWLSSC